jgi:glycine betaine/proline transport system permease protein
MDIQAITDTIDSAIDTGLTWLSDNGAAAFDTVRFVLENVYSGIAWVLQSPPFYVVVLAFALIGWRAVGIRFAVAAAIGLAGCAAMGLWAEAMATLALIATATTLALTIAIPIGILAGYNVRLNALLRPVLDLLQTLPPYIYLLPAIALMGYGPATALCATVVVAIAPALRLTALGISLTPESFIELGRASGSSPLQMFFKIRLPFAMPSIMAGANQCLMVAFGMVVIAGIVGSGGLGATIYDAVRTLEIGKSIDAGLAIVILTMILDRITEGAVRPGRRKTQ